MPIVTWVNLIYKIYDQNSMSQVVWTIVNGNI